MQHKSVLENELIIKAAQLQAQAHSLKLQSKAQRKQVENLDKQLADKKRMVDRLHKEGNALETELSSHQSSIVTNQKELERLKLVLDEKQHVYENAHTDKTDVFKNVGKQIARHNRKSVHPVYVLLQTPGLDAKISATGDEKLQHTQAVKETESAIAANQKDLRAAQKRAASLEQTIAAARTETEEVKKTRDTAAQALLESQKLAADAEIAAIQTRNLLESYRRAKAFLQLPKVKNEVIAEVKPHSSSSSSEEDALVLSESSSSVSDDAEEVKVQTQPNILAYKAKKEEVRKPISSHISPSLPANLFEQNVEKTVKALPRRFTNLNVTLYPFWKAAKTAKDAGGDVKEQLAAQNTTIRNRR